MVLVPDPVDGVVVHAPVEDKAPEHVIVVLVVCVKQVPQLEGVGQREEEEHQVALVHHVEVDAEGKHLGLHLDLAVEVGGGGDLLLLAGFDVFLLVDADEGVGVDFLDDLRELAFEIIDDFDVLVEGLLVVYLHFFLDAAVVEPDDVLVNILGKGQDLTTGAFSLDD